MSKYDGFLPVSDNYDTSFMDEDIGDDEINNSEGYEEEYENYESDYFDEDEEYEED